MNPDPGPAPLVGVAAIVRRGDRFLLIKRGRPPNLGLWAFPGGKQEWGETIDEAVRRELMEETGVTAADARLVTVLDIIDRDAESRIRHHYTLVVMALEWQAGEGRAGGDAAAAGWVAVENLDTMPVVPSTAALMRAAIG